MSRFNWGFTLVEVLVAIAIFAVLSAMGWQVFDQLLKNRDRNAEHAAALSQLQAAYGQLTRDMNQTVPVSGRTSDSIGAPEPAFEIDSEHIAFNKAGVVDPLQLGLEPFEHIEYRFDSARQLLLRYRYPLYRHSTAQPKAETVLSHLSQLQFEALDPAAQSQFPVSSNGSVHGEPPSTLSPLPKGIALHFEQNGESYLWKFALVSHLKLEAASNANANANNDANANQNASASSAPSNAPSGNLPSSAP